MARKVKRLKSKKSYRVKLKPSTVYSICQITFFALAGLVIVSFSRKGSILISINDLLILYFSWATIFLPFIFLSFGFLVSKFRNPLAQPNVVVGSLLMFISIATLGRAGYFGLSAWEGISGLVTGAGAAIILLGTTLVGIIVMFNTSLDQILGLLATFLKQLKFYIL